MSVNAPTLDDGKTPRCQALTKAKTQCKRAARVDSEFCGAHQTEATETIKAEDFAAEIPAAEPVHRRHSENAVPGQDNYHPNLHENRRKRRLQRGEGNSVGITVVRPGQILQSPRGAVRKAKRAARAAKRAHARGNGGK